ncbi:MULTISPECIES: hypothetical protein [Xenorhabdus]|uniref:Uncharacterized protein n=1 Tax=Xenorhabdus ehlersii TaxID=290111 RepID=A0A2D0IS93_9GAMM|nr:MULTISPECIES: hypothetical protein [Xenorhabdus]MBC8949572.1 hypothetical protein [Xenorhabdus sp. TS4]PHM24755.1 hypothetical protein Xehl_02007 [Xenorhabdus ehlersii]RKE91390.1 hypothetical protein BDE27_1612 [Xenorhabdus ehlersii]
MKRKLAACMLSLLVGTIITTNANAFLCKTLNADLRATCEAACNLIPDGGTGLSIAKQFCL